jgi:hypothetical protein
MIPHQDYMIQQDRKRRWKEIELGVYRWIEELHQNTSFNQHHADLDTFLKGHLLFVTAHFPSGTDPMTEFEKLLFRTMKGVFGKKVQRQRHLQPRAFAFLDMSGSKYRDNVVDVRAEPNLHVHALIVCRPEVIDSFRGAFSNPTVTRMNQVTRSGHIKKDLDVSAFDANQGPIKHLIGYCMKGLMQTPPDVSMDLHKMFPAPRSESQAGNHSRKSTKLQRSNPISFRSFLIKKPIDNLSGAG